MVISDLLAGERARLLSDRPHSVPHDGNEEQLRGNGMKTRQKIALGLGLVTVLTAAPLLVVSRSQAHRLMTNAAGLRKVPQKTPADYQLPFREVAITNQDGLRLFGWYVPSSNGAAVLLQHGYKMSREEMLPAAAALHRGGYGVLLSSVRAHDLSDGEQITFGVREIQDMEAWFEYLKTRPDVNPEHLGALGNSMGGSLVIQLAARNPGVKAVVVDSPFSSLKDTVATSVKHFTGLPAFPFAPLIFFCAEVESGCHLCQIEARTWIKSVSPRPVLMMQGGADETVSQRCGELLYAAAAEPKERWYDPAAGHASFSTNMPAYAQRVVGFFDKHLLPIKKSARVD